MVTACVLLAGAVVVRVLPSRMATRAEDLPQDGTRIVEPLQFLSRGARLRATELEELVRPGLRGEYRAAQQALFNLQGCPRTIDWLDGADGQRCERLLNELRGGDPAEAFAALTLCFQLARTSAWRPGLRGDARSAERLGGLLQDWLRIWALRGAADPLLSEPALAATLLYGRVMRSAWRSPMIGNLEAPYLRGKQFLLELCGPLGRRTVLGRGLELRFARALQGLDREEDAFAGFDEECGILFPSLDGGCGG